MATKTSVTRTSLDSVRKPKTLSRVFERQMQSSRHLHTSKRCMCTSSSPKDVSESHEASKVAATDDSMSPSTEGVFHTIGNAAETDSHKRMLTLIFTCNICEKRSARQFSHHAYTKGVVIIQCPGCEKYHLISDHLGWFQEGKNIEEFMAKKGDKVHKITDASEITPEIQAYVNEAAAERQASESRRAEYLKEKEQKLQKQAQDEASMRDLVRNFGARR